MSAFGEDGGADETPTVGGHEGDGCGGGEGGGGDEVGFVFAAGVIGDDDDFADFHVGDDFFDWRKLEGVAHFVGRRCGVLGKKQVVAEVPSGKQVGVRVWLEDVVFDEEVVGGFEGDFVVSLVGVVVEESVAGVFEVKELDFVSFFGVSFGEFFRLAEGDESVGGAVENDGRGEVFLRKVGGWAEGFGRFEIRKEV